MVEQLTRQNMAKIVGLLIAVLISASAAFACGDDKTPISSTSEPEQAVQGPLELNDDSGHISFIVNPYSTYLISFYGRPGETIAGEMSSGSSIDFGMEETTGSDFFAYADVMGITYSYKFLYLKPCQFFFENHFSQPQRVSFSYAITKIQ